MSTSESPIYESPPSLRSLGQRYYVYADHVLLDTWLGRVRIPFADLEGVDIRPPLVILDVFSGPYTLAQLSGTIKVDLADLNVHVALRRRSGMWRQYRITPDDPDAFRSACRRAWAAWRERHADAA